MVGRGVFAEFLDDRAFADCRLYATRSQARLASTGNFCSLREASISTASLVRESIRVRKIRHRRGL